MFYFTKVFLKQSQTKELKLCAHGDLFDVDHSKTFCQICHRLSTDNYKNKPLLHGNKY